MKNMTLLPEEEVITIFNQETIVLTNIRVSMNNLSFGKKSHTTIFLDDIASVQSNYSSKPWLILSGLVCGIVPFAQNQNGFVDPNQTVNFFAIFTCIVLICVYFITRFHIVKICSKGGASLIFKTAGMKTEDVDDFVAKLCSAKQLKSIN